MNKGCYKIERHWISSAVDNKECYPSGIALRKAEVQVVTGLWDKAVDLYQQVLAAAERLGADHQRAESLFRLGEVFRLKSEYPAALEHLSKCKQLFEELSEGGGAAKAAGAMGGVFGEQGDYQQALECFSERKDWAEKTGDKMELGIAWGNLGVIYAEQKMLDRALECYRQQKKLAEETGDLLGVSLAEGNSGNMYLYQGEYDTAIEHMQRQMELAAKIGDKRTLCGVTCNLGLLFKRQAQLEKSLEYLHKAVQAASEIGYIRVVSVATGNEGVVCLQLGRWDQARHHLEEHKKLTEEMEDCPGQIIALVNLSKLEELAGDPDKPQSLLRAALEIAGKSKLTNLRVIILNTLAELLLEQNNPTEASNLLRQAASLNREQEDPEQTAVMGFLSLLLELEQGEASALKGLKELAESEASESIKMGACIGLYRHTGDNDYLEAAGELSEKLYAQTRDVEYKIRMDRLRARKPVKTREYT